MALTESCAGVDRCPGVTSYKGSMERRSLNPATLRGKDTRVSADRRNDMKRSEHSLESTRGGGPRILAWLMTSALFGLVHGPAQASEASEVGDLVPWDGDSEAGVEAPRSEVERFAWSGLVSRTGDDGSEVFGLDPSLAGEEDRLRPLRDELADLRLAFQVQRKPQQALEGLWELRKRATYGSFEGQLDFLAECALHRSSWLEMLGKQDEATAALENLWLDRGEFEGTPDPKVYPRLGESRLLQERRALGAPQLVSARAARTGGVPQDGADEDVILSHVRHALVSGYSEVLRGLGRSALPALRTLSIEAPNSLPGALVEDPVYHFVKLAELEAANFLLANFDEGGAFWHKRILRAITEAKVLENRGTWEGQLQFTASSVHAPVLKEPEWLPLLARLLEDPTTVDDTLELVHTLAVRNALDDRLRAGLFGAANSEEPDVRRRARDILLAGAGWSSTKPVFERALSSADPEMRNLAVEGLLKYADVGTLRDQIAHGDPVVRAGYVRSLMTRQVPIQYSVAVQATTQQYIKIEVPLAPGNIAAVRRLLGDPAATVRGLALNAAMEYREAFDWTEEEITRLCKDEDVNVRHSAVWISPPDLALVGPGFEILAEDPEPSVLRALDSRLKRVRWSDPGAEKLGPALEARWWNLDHPFLGDEDSVTPRGFVTGLFAAPEVAGRLLEQSVERLDERMIEGAYQKLGNDGYLLEALVDGLGSERATATLLRIMEIREDPTWLQDALAPNSRPWKPANLETLAAWSDDPRFSLEVRARALYHSLEGKWPGAADLLVEFVLGDEDFRALDDPVKFLGDRRLHKAFEELDEADYDRVSTQLLSSKESNPWVASALIRYHTRALEVPTLIRVIEEGERHPEALGSLASNAIYLLRWDAENLPDARLAELAEIPELSFAVLSVIGSRRSEGWEEQLGRFLDPSWIPNPQSNDLEGLHARVVKQTIGILGGATSDAAAKELLRGLDVVGYPSLRTSCRVHLESLRARREEKRLWERHFAGVEEREEGVQRLLVLLGDESTEIRIEAIRALGTMGVVDAMPKLVDLLRSDDAEIRSEARAALDKLNRESEKDEATDDE